MRQAESTLEQRRTLSELPPPPAWLKAPAQRLALPLCGFAGLIVLWWAVVRLFNVPEFILPSPASVLRALADKREILFFHAQYTTVVVIAGFLVAVAIAVPLALVISFSRTLSAIFYPLIVSTQAVPKVALAPLILMWVG